MRSKRNTAADWTQAKSEIKIGTTAYAGTLSDPEALADQVDLQSEASCSARAQLFLPRARPLGSGRWGGTPFYKDASVPALYFPWKNKPGGS